MMYFAEKGTTAFLHYACEFFLCHSERSEESVKHALRVCVMSVFLAAAAPRELSSPSPRMR